MRSLYRFDLRCRFSRLSVRGGTAAQNYERTFDPAAPRFSWHAAVAMGGQGEHRLFYGRSRLRRSQQIGEKRIKAADDGLVLAAARKLKSQDVAKPVSGRRRDSGHRRLTGPHDALNRDRSEAIWSGVRADHWADPLDSDVDARERGAQARGQGFCVRDRAGVLHDHPFDVR